MSEFSYIIRTDKGSRETGNISAENYNDALEKLQENGSAVIKLIERDSSFDFITIWESTNVAFISIPITWR